MRRKARRLMAAAVLGAAAILPACSQSAEEGQAGAAAEAAATAALPGRTDMLVMSCSGCHSEAGEAIADLSGYTQDRLMTALSDYRNDAEGTTVMHRLMRGYSEADIEAISAYLGKGKAG